MSVNYAVPKRTKLSLIDDIESPKSVFTKAPNMNESTMTWRIMAYINIQPHGVMHITNIFDYASLSYPAIVQDIMHPPPNLFSLLVLESQSAMPLVVSDDLKKSCHQKCVMQSMIFDHDSAHYGSSVIQRFSSGCIHVCHVDGLVNGGIRLITRTSDGSVYITSCVFIVTLSAPIMFGSQCHHRFLYK